MGADEELHSYAISIMKKYDMLDNEKKVNIDVVQLVSDMIKLVKDVGLDLGPTDFLVMTMSATVKYIMPDESFLTRCLIASYLANLLGEHIGSIKAILRKIDPISTEELYEIMKTDVGPSVDTKFDK